MANLDQLHKVLGTSTAQSVTVISVKGDQMTISTREGVVSMAKVAGVEAGDRLRIKDGATTLLQRHKIPVFEL